jgi:uracil-DNA glycosylase
MTWQDFIHSEMQKDYFRELSKFLAKEAKSHTIFPPKERIFAAFDYCPLDKVKCVVLGQDPFHNPTEAHGLCFSVPRGVAIPPSLRNIYKELQNDLGIEPPKHGCLERWATEQGVLLLNSVLTVRAGQAGSHREHGWEKFTDRAIELIDGVERPIVFVFWGAYAKAKERLLVNDWHYVLRGSHPSPLSANRGGFFGGKYFSRTNEFLVENGIEPIDWRIK